MTEAEKYQGYDWIKVKREIPTYVDGVPYVSESHHMVERCFLIEEVRKLAAKVDALTMASAHQALEQLERTQKEQRRQIDDLTWEE